MTCSKKTDTRRTQETKTYLTYCPICKSRGAELIIGEVFKYKTPDGKLIGYDHAGRLIGYGLLAAGQPYEVELLDEKEMVPSSRICDDCAAAIRMQQAMFKQEVERGGVNWVCSECGQSGVIAHDDSKGFSKGVREQMQLPPPAVVTVSFARCDQHASEEDKYQTLQ